MSSIQPSRFSKQFASLEITGIQLTGKILGKGSDATVKEVNWVGTSCAAKQLHEILLEDESLGGAKRFLDNFEKECMTWSKLIHPHIVQFLGVFFLSGSRVPMLILEKMDTSLRHYLENHTKENFVLSDKIYVLRQVAQALSYLHSRSPPLVHHDLSPNNVLLNEVSLQAKVTDFGMTRAMDPSKMTRKSSAKGTQAFMPPEALHSPPKYDEKLDVFSYGNVIVTTVIHDWPEPGPPTTFERGKIIGFSELQRRQQYLVLFTPEENELFLPILRPCLQNDPTMRPTSIQLVTQMRWLEESHPRRAEDATVIPRLLQFLRLKDEQLREKDQQLREQDQQLRGKDQQLRGKDQQLREQDQQLHEQDQQLRGKEQQLHEQDQQLHEQDQQLRGKDQQLREQDQQLHEQDQQLRGKDQQLRGKDQQLREQDQQLRGKDQQLCEKQKEINSLRKDHEAFRKDQGRRHRGNEQLCRHLRFLQEEIDRLQSTSSPVSQYYCQLLMGEFKLESVERALLALELIKGGREFGECITLAKNCRNMEEVERYRVECPICCHTFMMDDMVTMLPCTCSVCKECFKAHYTITARLEGIANFNCCCCGQPDFRGSDIDLDDYLTMFANLLKVHLEYEDYQLFQKKATEFALSKDDNFRWCAHCLCGFIHEPPANRRIRCPHCEKNMCFHCKKPWEDQHKGINCIDFARWKTENEEKQQKGLAAFLKEYGMECPKCKFMYDLAREGCLHFKCRQCGIIFCGGCGAVFDKNCRKFQDCGYIGFHAHHPRDCLFYMRDWEVERLQKVLQDKKIEFDTEPPQNQVNASQVKGEGDEEGVEEPTKRAVAVVSANRGLRCRVMLQEEIGSCREECGEDCKKGHAGLCEKHYKEYLVIKINEAGIDPGEFMNQGEIEAVLRRNEKQVPIKRPYEGYQAYLRRLREHLKTEIFLVKRGHGMFKL